MENSIDAGASQITIEIEEAGLKTIQVTDNGEGIDHEDVPLALRRHATSKIKKQADLFRIRTLGFRGEAIPSIASVSRFTIETDVYKRQPITVERKWPTEKGLAMFGLDRSMVIF